MFARPKAGESEEDILKLHEEFLSKNPTPSATVISKRKSEQGNETGSGMYTRLLNLELRKSMSLYIYYVHVNSHQEHYYSGYMISVFCIS
jgi:hypothetical protein